MTASPATVHHLDTPTAPTPIAFARTYAADLRALDPLVQAAVVPGKPSCLDACEHRSGCSEPCPVWISTWDPLTGEPIDTTRCYKHGRSWVLWLLADPYLQDVREPQNIDVEVRVAATVPRGDAA